MPKQWYTFRDVNDSMKLYHRRIVVNLIDFCTLKILLPIDSLDPTPLSYLYENKRMSEKTEVCIFFCYYNTVLIQNQYNVVDKKSQSLPFLRIFSRMFHTKCAATRKNAQFIQSDSTTLCSYNYSYLLYSMRIKICWFCSVLIVCITH